MSASQTGLKGGKQASQELSAARLWRVLCANSYQVRRTFLLLEADNGERSMSDALQLGLMAAISIAFVFIGCLATRPEKRVSYTDATKE
jgi:hypothetical protein